MDLAAAPFVPRRRHRRHLSFSKPFLHSTVSILIRAPRAGDDISILFMEDLLNQTRINFGVVDRSKTHKDLKSATEGIEKAIWEKMNRKKRSSIIPSLKEALVKVRRGNFALILQSTDSTYLASKRPCDLMSLDQFLSITHYMMALKKGNGLTEEIDRALVKLQQEGILQMLFHKWWNSDECLGVTEEYEEYHQHNETGDNVNQGFITDLSSSETTMGKVEKTTLLMPEMGRLPAGNRESSSETESNWRWWVRSTAQTLANIYTQPTSAPFGPITKRRKGRRRHRNRHRNSQSTPILGHDNSLSTVSTFPSHQNGGAGRKSTNDYDDDYGFAWLPPQVTPSTITYKSTTQTHRRVDSWWEHNSDFRTPDYSVGIQTNGHVKYQVVDKKDDDMEDIFKYEGEYNGYEDYYIDNNRNQDYDHSDIDLPYEVNTDHGRDNFEYTEDYVLDDNGPTSGTSSTVSKPSALSKARILIVLLFAMLFSGPHESH